MTASAPPPAERSFFDFTATRPVAIGMVVAAVVVFGVVGLFRLPVNLLPDISYPSVTVRTTYTGASPRDVEDRISERVQEAVSVIPGVRRVVSISRPEVSDVVLEFDWGTRMVFAVADIRDRLDRVVLPREADDPLVLRYDPSLDPVMTFGLIGDASATELRRLAEEEIEVELAEISGVAAVRVRGGEEEEIRISLDQAAASFYGIDVRTIVDRLAAENVNAASGAIEEGKTEYLVRVIGEFPNIEAIEQVVLDRRGEVPIRLAQVAEVRRVAADREVISTAAGQPSVLVDVYKEANANVVSLCAELRDRVFGSDAQREWLAANPASEGASTATVVEASANANGETADEDSREARRRAFAEQQKRREMTDYLEHQLAEFGARPEIFQDQSRFVQTAVDDVLSSAIKGGLFAIAIIYLSLRRFSTTAILAVSIPISLVATFAPMFMSAIDLNIMSLGGLALGVGMLVDNSIVVLESIARAREEGASLGRAAVLGTSRVASAVTASTLTTVAVFFPIVFVEGLAGALFRDQALTVVYSLLLSLLVALFVIPMLASRGGEAQGGEAQGDGAQGDGATPATPRLGFGPRPGLAATSALGRAWAVLTWPLRAAGWLLCGVLNVVTVQGLRLVLLAAKGVGALLVGVLWPFAWAFDRVYRALDSVYPHALRAALRHRAALLLISVGLLTAAVLRTDALGTEVLPAVHQGELFVEAFLPRDATVERTAAAMEPIEKAVAELEEVERTFLACGVDDEELNDSDEGEHSARLLVRMRPDSDRGAQEERVRGKIRELLRREPEVQTYRFTRPSLLSFSAPLVVEVVGDDLVQLRDACTLVERTLASLPELRDVRSTLQRGNPEIAIWFDRDKLASLDLDPDDATRVLRAKILGEVPTRFAERERKIDMRVQVDRRELADLDSLLQVNINPSGRPEIPLASVARTRLIEGPSEIRRIGNVRGAEVQASLVGFDLGSTQERVVDALAQLALPRDIEVRLGGQKADLEESSRSLSMALLLAIFLVYVVMASQFESLLQPLVILVSLPLAMVGVVFTLDLVDMPLSVVVFLGAIVLAGIVVNNAIILIDQINRCRAAGMVKLDAIVRGAHTRLRPVLMTTLTTVLGLLPLTGWLAGVPLLGGADEGVELRAPMAITVIAGLTTSTLLTLLVVPVVYSLSDRRA